MQESSKYKHKTFHLACVWPANHKIRAAGNSSMQFINLNQYYRIYIIEQLR